MSIRTLSLVTLALAGLGHAQSKQFTVGDVEGRKVAQRFTVESDADFENFIGQTHRVSGWMKFDPTTKRGLGKLTVDLASIDTGIEMRNEHMRAEGWLNTTAFPKAVFETTQVEARADGTFVVTKHDGTGGLVTRNTVVSQLLYEMGDPKRYLGPDCTADFTSAKVEEVGKDRVSRPADDAPMMAFDERLDQFAALFETPERAVLVRAHKAAIADDVRTEDRRKLAFDFVNQGTAEPESGREILIARNRRNAAKENGAAARGPC